MSVTWMCGGHAARALLISLSLVFSDSLLLGQTFGKPDAMEGARQLEEAGQTQAAFLKYLSVSGGEFAAARLARTQPREFLRLLSEQGAAVPLVRRRLIDE